MPSPGVAMPVTAGSGASVDYLTDRQTEGEGEVQVTLIMSWHRHDRPGTVLSQHVVGGEQGSFRRSPG